jgi:hypothetical protein
VTNGTTSQPVRHHVFLRLLKLAFSSLEESDPVVVTMNDDIAIRLDHPWRSCPAASATDAADIATNLLHTAPVLLIPSWGRPSEYPAMATAATLRSFYEITVAGTRPSGPDALLVTLLPANSLTAPASRNFRETVNRSWQPCLVIFASNIFTGIHPSFDAAAVFWRPRSITPQSLKLFRLPLHEDEIAVERDFQGLLSRVSGAGRFGYVLADCPAASESLSIELHDPSIKARWSELPAWGRMVPLKEMFAFPAPALHSFADHHLLHDQPTKGAIRVLSGRDIRRDGTLAGADDSSRWAKVSQERQLRAGDILIRRLFATNVDNNLVVAEVTANDLPLAVNDSVVTLRPFKDLKDPQHLVAFLFLRSPLVFSHFAAHGSLGSAVKLTHAVLQDLSIPQPDTALAATLEGLGTARSRLEKWRNESDALLKSIFEDESAITARRRILESGRRLRMRVDAAELLDDFDHQVRTRYPHPIAYRWSEAQVKLSKGLHEAAYEAILEASEVLLCYAALIVLSLSCDAGLRLGSIDGIRKRLSRGGSNGPGFGDWTAILKESAESRVYRHLPDADPLSNFGRFFSNIEVTSAHHRLAQRRNDKAHLRHVDASDLPFAIQEAHADLATLLEKASFLTDLPLVHVTDVLWDNLQKTAQVEYQELMGDNVLTPGKERPHTNSDLEVGSLYLANNENGRLYLLRPFLLRRRCPLCRSWETFHVDSAPGPSTVTVKSLESGHTDADPSLRQPLKHVGLLE